MGPRGEACERCYWWEKDNEEFSSVSGLCHLERELTGSGKEHWCSHFRLHGPTVHIGPILPEGGIDFRKALERYKRSMIEQALEQAKGDNARAAELLRMKRTTFIEARRRMEKKI